MLKGEGGFLPEVALLTLREMDPFVRFRIGGLVVSRSVKYLGKLYGFFSEHGKFYLSPCSLAPVHR